MTAEINSKIKFGRRTRRAYFKIRDQTLARCVSATDGRLSKILKVRSQTADKKEGISRSKNICKIDKELETMGSGVSHLCGSSVTAGSHARDLDHKI